MRSTSAIIMIALALSTIFFYGCRKKKDDPANGPGDPTTSIYDFSWSANPAAGVAVTFTSTAPEGHNVAWKIDTALSAGRVANHIFPAGGVYYVSMVVDSNFASKLTKSITVDNPYVSCYYSGTQVVGDTIRFHVINGSSGKTFNWDFGDGSTSTDIEPAHIYHTAGTYKIKLRVDNKYDAKGNVGITIVNDPLYTYKISGNRAWQFANYRKYSDGTDTSYTTNEFFSIDVRDKLTVAMQANATLLSYMTLEYSEQLSKGNVLVFTHFNRKLYYDHVMDTLYLTDWDHYGKYNTQGVPVYDHYITGSSK